MNTLATFSTPDMIWIFLIALLLFGSKKLPELAKGVGQAVREFNKAKDEIEREITKAPDTKPAVPVTVQPAPDRQERLPAAPIAAAPVPEPVPASPQPETADTHSTPTTPAV